LGFDAWLRNASGTPLRGPIKLLISGIQSGRGEAEFVQPPGVSDATGAVTDVTGSLRGGELRPGELLSLGRMTIRIAGFTRGDLAAIQSVLKFNLRVYSAKH